MFEPTAIHVQPDGTELKQFSVRGDIPGFFEDCGKIMAQERVQRSVPRAQPTYQAPEDREG